MTTTLQTRIAEVLALADKATPGPWNLYFNSQDDFIVRKMFADGGEAHVVARVHSGAPNARFIVATPELADLLRQCSAEIERLERKESDLRTALTDMRWYTNANFIGSLCEKRVVAALQGPDQ